MVSTRAAVIAATLAAGAGAAGAEAVDRVNAGPARYFVVPGNATDFDPTHPFDEIQKVACGGLRFWQGQVRVYGMLNNGVPEEHHQLFGAGCLYVSRGEAPPADAVEIAKPTALPE